MISVIIPHHKETIKQMTPLLSSINAQVGINFQDIELLIINDNKTYSLNIENFQNFENINNRIKIFFNPKEGYIGDSRQIGIDNAIGDYILFCDSDDCLYATTLFYDLLNRKDADIYCFKFVEQSSDGYWICHDYDLIWVTAKLYKKDFLIKNNVRFSEYLPYNEDVYFNQVAIAYNPNIVYLDFFGYCWLYSNTSITRQDNYAFLSNSLTMFINAMDYRLERIKSIISKENLFAHIYEDIAYVYCALQQAVYLQISDDKKIETERRLKDYIMKYDSELSCLSNPTAAEIIIKTIRKQSNIKIFIPNEGFESFIKRITK